ncbi:elongation factor P maturation arginine rhamnosyltransferase EarP [Castellaniella sp.]|uniref:elongation factor P maturation arginine rhamnosyltransferase EarP n=1 Tax=Castellaniella sp. TaxID=1955812 RepID=UPI002AFDE18C|nr:elongation factor P maturation arginine rhamnosyltransferase EarP [Castellaniella sp.]
MPPNTLSFDLFCRVIDNYGDAGVCWRLARQLADMGHTVRLWIDDLATLARLVPAVHPDLDTQGRAGVTVSLWALAEHTPPPSAGVVIEAFGCTLPPAYVSAMVGQQCLWINLEYLSAESWIDGCHGLPSPQANGLNKYFYFPGFSSGSGGLLREPDLLARRRQSSSLDRFQRLQALTGLDTTAWPRHARLVLLFCYPDAPLAGLTAALARQSQPTYLLVPGQTPAGLTSLDQLHVQSFDFVPQDRFDELLWCCDLNIVRGEDSLVRAIWAGAPLVWHIYRQPESAHLDKLKAWLDRAQWPTAAHALNQAWNQADAAALAQAMTDALSPAAWKSWQNRSHDWSQALAEQQDLAHGLVAFYQKHSQTG